jgi:hypothetical protein
MGARRVAHGVDHRHHSTSTLAIIIDDDRFDLLHGVYLLSSTAQWSIGAFHVLCLAAIRAEVGV